MNTKQSFDNNQLVLSAEHPQWGYGRVIDQYPTPPGDRFWVYFYHTDAYVELSGEQMETVPENYQPPFAPDPDLYFAEKSK